MVAETDRSLALFVYPLSNVNHHHYLKSYVSLVPYTRVSSPFLPTQPFTLGN